MQCNYSGIEKLHSPIPMKVAIFLRDPRRDKGLTSERITDSTEDMDGILTGGREIASNLHKGIGPFERPEPPGNLLFDLDHPHIPFRLVIIKGDAEVLHERQSLWLKIPQPIQ